MPGHGDKRSPGLLQGNRQAACRLGRVDDQGHLPRPAQGRDLFDWQPVAEDIGNVCADHRVAGLAQRRLQTGQKVRWLEERPAHRHDLGPQGGQRPGDGVVLKAGDDGPASRAQQRGNGDVQPVGRVHGEDDLLCFRVKERGSGLAAGEERLVRRDGRCVAAAAGAGAAVHRLADGPFHLRRLFQRRRGGVKIDHRTTSTGASPGAAC